MKSARTAKATRWQSCNVLQAEADGNQLWQFAAAGGQLHLQAEHRHPPGQPLPPAVTARGWANLFHSRLNIAWLPAHHVFLRVAHVPRCDPGELPAMLELQLEKVSPLPVNQVFWTYELINAPEAEQQTVVFVVAERAAVERFLGDLEQVGYTADRLEVPLLHHVVGHRPRQDGTWLYLAPEGLRMLCLTAWWYGGQLQHVHLLQLPLAEPGPAQLVDHLSRMAWAGEIEGWLTDRPSWHLRVDPQHGPAWEAAVRTMAGDACTVETGPAPRETAVLSANQGTRGETRANLLPTEFVTRYRQLFVDRLWMQGLAGVLVLYLIGVAAYFAASRYEVFRHDHLRREIATVAPGYTNALTLKQRLRVFEEQAGLKYAALDCWRVVSELLPADVTLESFNFQGGDRLFLSGAVTTENQQLVTDFNADLRKVRIGSQLLFDQTGVEPPRFTPRGNTYRWDFNAKLRTSWLE